MGHVPFSYSHLDAWQRRRSHCCLCLVLFDSGSLGRMEEFIGLVVLSCVEDQEWDEEERGSLFCASTVGSWTLELVNFERENGVGCGDFRFMGFHI
eukprot:6750252-Ditylum_brightwellii.AAC.1